MHRFGMLLGLVLSMACASAPERHPDLLLTGGRVFTGDDARPWAEAVAVRGDTIVAVGASADVAALAGPATRVVDLGGKIVIPGINDAHIHAPWMDDDETPVRLPREGVTRESLLAALRDAASAAPAASLLVAELPISLVDVSLTRDDLDAISTSHRIRVDMPGGHSAVLNTAALRDWEVAEDAADPAGGWYGRNAGRLNGWLYEHALWMPKVRIARAASDDQVREAIRAFETLALKFGITSVQTMSPVGPVRLEALLASSPAALRWRVIDFRMAPFDGSAGRFPVKYVVDGTPFERSAALREPYSDDASGSGQLNYSLEDIDAMVRDAARGERQLLVHAVGDRTIAAFLDAMERTPADWPSLRLRIEHGDTLLSDLRERARFLGITFVQNPAHFMIPDVMNPRYGTARAKGLQPARSLVDAGFDFALGSDGPLNPFLNMFFATAHPVNPSESLTVEQSLRAYTSAAARAEFQENRKGKLAPGMLADLAVLSQDIFAVPPDALPQTRSAMTIVGGRVVWEAPPSP